MTPGENRPQVRSTLIGALRLHSIEGLVAAFFTAGALAAKRQTDVSRQRRPEIAFASLTRVSPPSAFIEIAGSFAGHDGRSPPRRRFASADDSRLIRNQGKPITIKKRATRHKSAAAIPPLNPMPTSNATSMNKDAAPDALRRSARDWHTSITSSATRFKGLSRPVVQTKG